MRKWASEIRTGIIAGVSAGALLLAAPKVATLLPIDNGDHAKAPESWTPPLADPIQSASAALARGDSAFIAIAMGDTLGFPGLTPAASKSAAQEAMRMYSPASTGLRGEQWDAFVPQVVPYAAAYNAVVQVARTSTKVRS